MPSCRRWSATTRRFRPGTSNRRWTAPRRIPRSRLRSRQRSASSARVSAYQSPVLSQSSCLVPALGVLRKTGALHSDYAEALAGGRLHHHPALEAVHDLGAEFRQTCDFRRNIVGLNVDVDAALVIDALDLHDGLIGWRFEHQV